MPSAADMWRRTNTQTDSHRFRKGDKWLRVGASRLRVPAALEVLDSWYLLWTIDLYFCNICAMYYTLFYSTNFERKEMNKNKQIKTLFNSEKSLIVLLGTLHYASSNPLPSHTLSGFSGRILEILQHIGCRLQSSPQIGQAQVCLQTTGLVPC